MTSKPALRRLRDLPGVKDLEYQAVLKRDFVEPQAPFEYPAINACTTALFGLTAEEAEAVQRPQDWDDIELAAPAVQAATFEAEGWDVTDDKHRPLRVLAHLAAPLALALRAVAGSLPFAPEPEEKNDWASKLDAEARRFTKR